MPAPPSIEETKEQIKETLVPEIVTEMSKNFDSQWKHYLISQIGQVENQIVINGLEKSRAEAKNFFDDFCEIRFASFQFLLEFVEFRADFLSEFHESYKVCRNNQNYQIY